MSNFLAACRNEATEVVPVWFMRQAGRALPEYRELRQSHDILSLCRTPDLAAEVTLQPVRRLGVDAAILFSDIVVPLDGMGVDLDIEPGVGPVIASPVRSRSDAEALPTLEPGDHVPHVLEAIRILVDELDVPLIGFAGAPFTLASYLIEGGPSKSHGRTKAMMLGEPDAWSALMSVLTESTIRYLNAQIEAGVAAVQLFDSWAGHVAPAHYRAHVLPWVRKIFEGIGTRVPRIVFGVGTGELLPMMGDSGAEVVGIDWRVPLDEGRSRRGGGAVQGNLDPAACLAPWEVVRAECDDILRRGEGRGHVFNLGHGVLPETDPGVLERIVDHVHAWRAGD